MKSEDYAYAAGIIDGEGSISIVRTAPKHGRQSPAFNLDISMAMTDDAAIRWLFNTFGGCFCSAEPKNPKHRRKYIWHLYGALGDDFLKQIQRFVKVKAPQVALALALRESVRATRYRGSHRLPQDIIEYRERLCHDMHTLNRRGRARLSFLQQDLI